MTGGISALYILDKKGRVLISRNFRSDIPANIHDIFIRNSWNTTTSR